MLWVKAFHIVFVASWFAGLFYLPRIYVNLAMVPPGSVAERERFDRMSRACCALPPSWQCPRWAWVCGCG